MPIAGVTFSGTSSRITEILQHHTGLIECPDRTPQGVIAAWSGSVSAVPYGWGLCDGTHGPDLSGRFVIGSKTDSGGAVDVGDSQTGDIGADHLHAITDPNDGDKYLVDGTVTSTVSTYRFVDMWALGQTDASGPIIPYYALAYIKHL